jgi:hypothetical protein
VATFLKRIEALEAGTDRGRTASRKEDKQAVALLEKRGLTTAERKRLGKLVDIALGPTPVLDSPASTTAQGDRRQALLSLKLWYNEWATVAHATIRKRNHLIRLGLASRHVSRREPALAPTETAASADTRRTK